MWTAVLRTKELRDDPACSKAWISVIMEVIRCFKCIYDRNWSLELIGRWLKQDDIDISDTDTCRNFKGPKMDLNLNS